MLSITEDKKKKKKTQVVEVQKIRNLMVRPQNEQIEAF
jgi:hypothetical protein